MELDYVVSDLKCKYTNTILAEYAKLNYGLRNYSDSLLSEDKVKLKLELTFIENIGYLHLTKSQLLKVATRNYKNLLKGDTPMENIDLVKIKPIREINNNITINNGSEEWGKTEW